MKTWFAQFGQQWPLVRLTRGVALASFIIDIFSVLYFHLYWLGKDGSYLLWRLAFLVRGENFLELDPSYQRELVAMANMTVDTFLVAILIVNVFFYLYLQFYKHWAWQYVVGYLGSAALLTILSALEGFPLGPVWGVANIISIICYGLLALALRNRKSDFNQRGFRLKRS